jgi:hypothetical protein
MREVAPCAARALREIFSQKFAWAIRLSCSMLFGFTVNRGSVTIPARRSISAYERIKIPRTTDMKLRLSLFALVVILLSIRIVAKPASAQTAPRAVCLSDALVHEGHGYLRDRFRTRRSERYRR